MQNELLIEFSNKSSAQAEAENFKYPPDSALTYPNNYDAIKMEQLGALL
jgi:hypothetical protein